MFKSNLKKIFYWLPALLYMGLIYYLSSFPAPGAVQAVPIILKVKLVHLVEYGLLSALLWGALIKTTGLKPGEIAALAIMLTILYGATDELHQVFVPFRTGSNVDLVVNGIGAAMMQAAIFYMRKRDLLLHFK